MSGARPFLISGGAVDLPGAPQARHRADLQRPVERARVDMIIFDRISGNDHRNPLEALHRAQHFELHIGGKRSRDAVRIDEEVVEPLRFEKYLMPVAVGKAVDLVLDRRAIARARCADRAREQRRAIEIRRDDRMRPGVGPRDCAENLGHRPRAVPRGTGPARALGAVRWLFVEPRPVDRPTVEPRRRSGLEPRHRQFGAAQLLREPVRAGLADASALHPLLAAEEASAEEGPRREHDRARDQHRAVGQLKSLDAPRVR
jgi:hypothetical protein